jgi:ATP-binding protein involved in chromosome partitioning
VIDPELKRNVVELDMVRDVRIEDGDVTVGIALTIAGCPLRSSFEEQVAQALAPVEGVQRVSLEFGVMTPEERGTLTARLRGSVTERTKGIQLDRSTRVIAVASGKGGVGKSTLSANLAAAFDQLGQRTGILDADVYGHSIPHLLGIHQKPVAVDRMIVPPVRGELKLMSIGFFLDGNEPVMWRGPMLHRALEQFLTDVHWGELDTLVVDMPPGTGDVSISLGQLLPRAAAGAGGRGARRADGAQDEHAAARRDREHERRRVRPWRGAASSRRARGAPARDGAARPGVARVRRCGHTARRE